MEKLLTALFVTLAGGCTSQHAFAWGHAGHHIVAEIAIHYLSQPARKEVLHILGSTSPEDAATWMDDMRSDPAYDYMKPWHYLDIPKGEVYKPGGSNNLITALNQAFNDVKLNRVNAVLRKQDVMMLFHLPGDLHQPLHTGYAEDKGGNLVLVNYHGTETNLHHVWDDDIIAHGKITAEECLTLDGILSKAMLQAIQAGNFLSWMQESRLHLPEVYAFTGHTLTDAYMQKNKALVERQLFDAGLRLAQVLNALFGGASVSDQTIAAGTENILKDTALRDEGGDRRNLRPLLPVEAAQHIGRISNRVR